MTKDNPKTNTPEKEHVFGVVWYSLDSPEEFKLDWFLTLNSLMFFVGKLQRRLSTDFQIICFEKELPEVRADFMVTKKMHKAYLEDDFTLIEKTPAEHFKDQKLLLRRRHA